MAYMSQERKAQIAPGVKAVLKKYGLKGSLAVSNHSSLVLNIKSGKIDFESDYDQVNVYHIDSHYSGKAAKALSELRKAMSVGNWDKSDIQTDYFDVGWYVRINVGQWNKPYVLEK